MWALNRRITPLYTPIVEKHRDTQRHTQSLCTTKREECSLLHCGSAPLCGPGLMIDKEGSS